jgi:hypothetical protein
MPCPACPDASTMTRDSHRGGIAMTTTRSPEDVFAHHAQALMAGDVEEIISDYSDDAILIVGSKVSRGRDGARDVFTQLLQEAPQAIWEVEPVFAEDVLYLEWRARSGSRQLDGIDTFIFGDGRIRVQTVRYTVQGD